MFIANISQTVDQLYLSKITIQILTTNKAFYKQIHFRLTKCINKPCANTERNRFFSSVCFHNSRPRKKRTAKSEERSAKSEERRGTPIGRNSLNTRRELVPCASPGLSYGLSLATGLHQRQGLDGFENYLPR